MQCEKKPGEDSNGGILSAISAVMTVISPFHLLLGNLIGSKRSYCSPDGVALITAFPGQ